MHISVDAVNVMAAYQPVVLTCVHCGGRIETMQLLHDLRSVHETHTTFKVSSTNAAVFLQLVKITSLDIFCEVCF